MVEIQNQPIAEQTCEGEMNKSRLCCFYDKSFCVMNAATDDYIHKIVAYFKGQPVLRAWLFGSYSRGDETVDSDIDLLVDYDKSRPLSLLRICSMITDLEDMLGRRVDLVENGRLKDFAVASVNNDKILIYERANQR
ncbi:nucleotidyltransferase family protein [uncultured Muribaculum sp.]|jgi:hypothetical protein|uniref:nucleotidyltransferase family protein n=1 Tax=uncultured Muribaculum sp. TaxID=1918613 RepID=UPI00263B671E|nr:nucleotidyltransferase domain-containing protein [uncultured Muribaculum sp.]